MFSEAMDPELFRMAQEQIGRMSPSDFSRIQQQVMSNPDLMRMASENIKNLSPNDLKVATERLKNSSPEDMAKMSEMMAHASSADVAAMRSQYDARAKYEIDGAQRLKNQGNELHSQGRYIAALEKYLKASKALDGISSSQAKNLSIICSLNIMSCYMKTKQYEKCIEEGSKVLEYDALNLKALYRRGQAYKELGSYKNAVKDLKKAMHSSPDDETIAIVLREVEENLANEDANNKTKGVVIEEITEEDNEDSKPTTDPEEHFLPNENYNPPPSSKTPHFENITDSELLRTVNNDPEATRSFQRFISNVGPETLASLSNENAGNLSPEMFQYAQSMMNSMSPEDFPRMLQMASQFQGKNVSPEMLKTAGDMINKMTPQEREEMLKVASKFQNPNTCPPMESEMRETMVKDPDTLKMAASMMRNVSPEMLSNMSEQFGVKLSCEDAERAQQAMSSISPEAFEKMMIWSQRVQRGVQAAKSTKQWLLGTKGVVLALLILLISFIIRWWVLRLR